MFLVPLFALALPHLSLELTSLLSLRWLSRLNMAAVGYAERERIRQEQGQGSESDRCRRAPNILISVFQFLSNKPSCC